MSMIRGLTGAFILVLAFAVPGRAVLLLDKIVAVVNKEVITWGELYRAMEFKGTEEFRALSSDEKLKVFKENETAFLEGMIDTRLQLQAAKKMDIDASKEELNEAIDGIKKKYGLNDAQFDDSLKREGFTLVEYKKMLAEQIILSKIVGNQVRSKIVVTDGEIADYLSKNKTTGYRLRQIFFKKPDKDSDPGKLEARAREIQRRLSAGEEFPALARQFSEDPSAKSGGDLGFVKLELLGKEFVETLASMKNGEVSKPFWTQRGLHIVLLEEREDTANPEELKELTRRRLMEKKFNDEYRNWIKGLREKAFVEVRL